MVSVQEQAPEEAFVSSVASCKKLNTNSEVLK